MGQFEPIVGAEVRAKLDHPVIDGDGHIAESQFALDDFLEQVAGRELAARAKKSFPAGGPHGATVKGFWWGMPSGAHTSDRALAMLPRYMRSRMDELGFDFAHCYTSLGLGMIYLHDAELRRATCRALNMMYADMFKSVGDRLRPVAVIPTYTPQEAIEELEFAVTELGFKAAMIGTEIRGAPRPNDGGDPFRHPTQSTRSIVMDSPYDYDPFWRKCIELKIVPVCHTSSRGLGMRASPTNYVFNHLGDFAEGANFFCRSLIFSGVTRRFPQLTFGFLEGGVAWALNLLNDLIEHWEKRNVDALLENLDPEKLDVPLLEKLFAAFGDSHLTRARIAATPTGRSDVPRPPHFDEFAACALREMPDLKALFIDPFYFGCEADDRLISLAFNRDLNPLGLPLKAVFGSDIGHWDVHDARTILSEAWGLVDAGMLDRDNFRDFTFANPAMLHLSMNPDYFAGTVLADEAKKLLAQRTPARAA
ncbi:MAG TPA: amidohydrolase family protein [Stellaceae bacterium]|jgi:predicted TIM-barrel fold metal-dependent hydrolase|nr:amidohydrolase family protein [Stellaceae bacterium]